MEKKPDKPMKPKLTTRIKHFYRRNWQWLWTTIIAFLSLWVRTFKLLHKD